MNLKNCKESGSRIKLPYLICMEHLQWMDDARNTKKIQKTKLHQKRPKGRSNARWKDNVQNDIRNMGIVKWGQVAHDGDGWRTNRQEVIIFG